MQTLNNRFPLAVKPGLALAMLGCLFIFFLMVTSFLVQFIVTKIPDSTAALRIASVLQDILIFILPAIVTALLSTRLPARFLMIEHAPKLTSVVMTLFILLASIPAMNMIVEWNNSISLPQSLKGVEEAMRAMEDNAQTSIKQLIGSPTVGGLIISILIVGLFAGFSEELLFRGALQRLFSFRMNTHVAIWLAAFIFSAFHLQFYGFIPRLLLGAFFGYLVVWSGSLWLPIIAHIFNNSLVVIAGWLTESKTMESDINNLGTNLADTTDIVLVVVSIILVSAGIYSLRRLIQHY